MKQSKINDFFNKEKSICCDNDNISLKKDFDNGTDNTTKIKKKENKIYHKILLKNRSRTSQKKFNYVTKYG